MLCFEQGIANGCLASRRLTSSVSFGRPEPLFSACNRAARRLGTDLTMDALHRNKHSVLRLFSLTACLISTAAASPAMITGVTAIEAVATYAPAAYLFLKRDECPRDTFQCDPSLGAVFSDICCQNGQTCAFDASDNPACCPSG